MVNRLKYRDFITVALVFEDEQPFPDNWIYIHDPKVKVGRIQNFKSWSPEMVPDEKYSCLGLEYFCFEHDGTWDMPDEKLIEMGLLEISRIGLAKKDTFVKGWVIRQPKAYPVYDDGYKDIISGLKAELDQYPTLHLVGRNGMHKYNNQDHSMMTAMLAVENIVSGFQRYDLWNVNEDAEYHEQYTTGTKEALTSLRMVPQPLKQKAEKVEYTYNKALGAIK